MMDGLEDYWTRRAATEAYKMIEAMAECVFMGEASSKAPSGAPYVIFVNGQEHKEGSPYPRFTGSLQELADITVQGIKAYRDQFEGPVQLTWREPPRLEVDSSSGLRWIYMRLVFEPIAQEAVIEAVADIQQLPPEPTSLAEHRALKAEDCTLWSPADALRSLLRRIEAGEVSPDRLAIHYVEPDADGGQTHHHVVANLTYETHLCLLVIGQHQLLESWRR